MGIFPQLRDENKKYLKPPPRKEWLYLEEYLFEERGPYFQSVFCLNDQGRFHGWVFLEII